MGTQDRPTDEIEAGTERAGTAVAEPRLLVSGRRLGERYRLERPLGHGGMAAVWLATDERLDRQVAIKILSDTLAHDREYLDRFRREAHVAAGLQHPNLVSIYDYGSGDRPYLVMEYIPRGDLAERIDAGDRPDPEQLAHELLAALRHIHAAGVLHRDIKPQNVLIDAAGHARLTDFGIAQPRDATALTKTGQVIGTERYLAPEVMQGGPASERADLYALGVVLADIAGDGPGAALRDLTDRLRDPDPERRPYSAAAALATLERESGPPVTPATATQPYPLEPRPPAESESAGAPPSRPFQPSPTGVREPARRRTALALIAAGLVVVALVVGLAIGSGGDDPSGVDLRERGESAQSGGGGSGGAEPEPAESAPAAPADTGGEQVAEPPPEEPRSEPAGTDGAALEQQGYELLQSGDPEGAIPVLERAVRALEGSGGATYYYALYNLGDALVQAGRPDEAIPYLEQRLEFDDGQLATVEAKLAEAKEAAGIPADDAKPGNGPKKEGKTPPPFQEGDED